MQKKIIALALAGLASSAAFAQSNVTIYGIAWTTAIRLPLGCSKTAGTNRGLADTRSGSGFGGHLLATVSASRVRKIWATA